MDLLGLRRVLDQLDQAVAEHHLARRDGEVAPRRERVGVDHGQPPLLEVAQEVARPVGDAGAAGLHRPAQRRRVGEQQERRAGRVDELLQVEAQPLALGGLEVLGLALLQQEVRGEQVQVLERAVDRVGVPFRGVEPLVLRARRAGLRRVPPLASPHQRAAASFQASTADFTICTFSSTIAGSARAGSAMRRSQTVRSARTTSAQSTGITSFSGLAFQARSIEPSSGSWSSSSRSRSSPAAAGSRPPQRRRPASSKPRRASPAPPAGRRARVVLQPGQPHPQRRLGRRCRASAAAAAVPPGCRPCRPSPDSPISTRTRVARIIAAAGPLTCGRLARATAPGTRWAGPIVGFARSNRPRGPATNKFAPARARWRSATRLRAMQLAMPRRQRNGWAGAASGCAMRRHVPTDGRGSPHRTASRANRRRELRPAGRVPRAHASKLPN